MTTLELIEQARKCADSYGCDECIYYNVGECNVSVMMERLADRLEMAYNDLRKQECWTCFYDHEDNYEMSVKYCFPCRTLGKNCVDHWQWRGDAE